MALRELHKTPELSASPFQTACPHQKWEWKKLKPAAL